MIKICDLEVSELYLFREQSYRGRVNVVYKDHGIELCDLSDEDRNTFFKDVARVGRAITKAFNPTKINYGAYSDTLTHIHMHIVPKYAEGYGFGGVFEMNPKKTYLTEEECVIVINQIRDSL
ncbi:MAG: HIT family protein [Mangrovibacterium sp.]